MDTRLQEVSMRRDTLAGDPRVLATAVPAPYTLRDYVPGDAATWIRIHREAEPYHEVTEALYAGEFAGSDALRSARQLFLCDGAGLAVGTATAWLPQAERSAALGRIHWVAITPAHQGRGLMAPLVAALCRRFLSLGHTGAYLTTESLRLRAIRGYLGMGFVPELRGAEDIAAWREVQRQGLLLPAETNARFLTQEIA